MDSANFSHFVELTLHPLGLLIAVGLVHILVLEFSHMHKLYSDSFHGNVEWKAIGLALFPRMRYLIGGVLVTMGAYVITTVIYRQFPSVPMNNPGLNSFSSDYHQAIGFVLAVTAFVLCGYALTVSAGNRWFVGLAKLFAVIGVLIIFAITAGVYLPLNPGL
jgi:hypothetical protein